MTPRPEKNCEIGQTFEPVYFAFGHTEMRDVIGIHLIILNCIIKPHNFCWPQSVLALSDSCSLHFYMYL